MRSEWFAVFAELPWWVLAIFLVLLERFVALCVAVQRHDDFVWAREAE